MPRHVNPTSRDRTATAPYNFVPMPERVFEVADGIDVAGQKIKPWEMHDRFVSGTHSGSIELTIETLTPLFIRGPVGQRQDGTWDARDSRLRPEPYTAPGGRPAIPGSSLRGMVRTLVEILSFSKIQPVDKGRPFLRTVAPDRIGRAYGERMRRGAGVRGGRLQRQGNEWSIVACDVLRVKRSILPNGIHQENRPNWAHQQRPCWVEVDGDHVSSIAFEQHASWKQGNLILTGDVPRKRREFVFLDAPADSERIVVPESILERFHDDDQITQWQETAFPRNQPQGGGRPAAGHLRDGEPVFFLTHDEGRSDDNQDGLVFLGRAGMFRFPYDRSPADLVPQQLRDAALDIGQAMFGKVDSGGAIKGRVHFEDAVATEGGPPWCETALVPRVLSAPKPTTFQHYLTQDGTKGKDQLTTYIEGDHTAIRGHKLYWHRDDNSGVGQIREANNHDRLLQQLRGVNPQDTQHTIIQPVKNGVTFVGRVRFENLTEMELGALLHALQLPDGCAHRLGMGKPLGLGSIRIRARVKVVERAARYRTWQATGIAENEDGKRFREAFRLAIQGHAQQSGETMLDQQDGLRQIARIDALFRLLEWTNRPAPAATAYMDLSAFRNRPVLPTPHGVAGASEPPWPANPPKPAHGGGVDGGQRRGRPDRNRGRQDGTAAAGSRRQERSTTRPAQVSSAGVKVGDMVEVVLLEEKTKKGGWKARHEASGLEGPIQNSTRVPGDKKPGDPVTVLVKIAKQRESAFEVPSDGHAGQNERKARR